MQNKLVVITVTGKDKPGITSSLTKIISESKAKILDIEQIVTHNLLSLSFVIDLNQNDSSNHILKELLFKAKEIGIELDFQVINESEIIKKSSRNTYAVTCMGNEISAEVISKLSAILYKNGVNIERITKLSEGNLNCIELIVHTSNKIEINNLKKVLLSLGKGYKVDLAFQKEDLYRKSKRLLVLDMDMTLIQMEVINEIAKHANKEKEIEEITEKAMNGLIDFEIALKERVQLLKGLDINFLNKVYESIVYTKGAKKLIKISQQLGYKTAVISGGFTYFTEKIKEELNLDYAYANELEIIDGTLTGKVIGNIIDGKAKGEIIEKIAEQENISLDQVIAVGDGANDLLMLEKAGLGIAFNAKQIVKDKADYSLSTKSLSSIFYFLGITEKEIELMDKSLI